MKKIAKKIMRNFRVVIKSLDLLSFFVFSFISLLFSIILPIWRLTPGIIDVSNIPLHYNIHSGVDLFGQWWRIFMAPGLGFLVIIINTVLALFFWRKDRMLSYFFLAFMMFSQILIAIAMIFIVLLNISFS